MKKILPVLLILISFSFTVNAQRQVTPRPRIQTNHVVRRIKTDKIRIPRRRIRLRNQRQDRIKQEIIQPDSITVKPRG
jgi:hypothetical protein